MELGAERLSYLTLHNQFQNLRLYLPYKRVLPELDKRQIAVEEQQMQTGGSEVGGASRDLGRQGSFSETDCQV